MTGITHTPHRLLRQLLRRNLSPLQITGYAIANIVGLSIVATALQLYMDVRTLWQSDDSFISRDYIILSRRVGALGSILSTNPTHFSDDDLADLKSQPWVRRAAPFTPSGFNVSAHLSLGGRSMSTALFMESIPDEYFDVAPARWHYTPGDTLTPVPVIISKEYLSLYNFGFAASRSLPQISEAMIGMVPLRLNLSGRSRQQYLNARIVGFSSRLNTIAVPQEFMQWANENFADQPDSQPSRVIVEVSSPGDPAISRYLQEHSLEAAGDGADRGRANYFAALLTSVVVAVGVVISVLAFFILLLSIHLLLQKNASKQHRLMMLGYTPEHTARPYLMLVCAINAGILAGAVAVMLTARTLWHSQLTAIGIHPTAPWLTIALTTSVMLLLSLGNILSIRRQIRQTFPRP